MSKLLELAAEIESVRGVADSAIALIEDLAQKIEDCQCNPGELAALVAGLRESREDLAFAVAANSDPVEPDPVVPDPIDDEEDEDTEG